MFISMEWWSWTNESMRRILDACWIIPYSTVLQHLYPSSLSSSFGVVLVPRECESCEKFGGWRNHKFPCNWHLWGFNGVILAQISKTVRVFHLKKNEDRRLIITIQIHLPAKRWTCAKLFLYFDGSHVGEQTTMILREQAIGFWIQTCYMWPYCIHYLVWVPCLLWKRSRLQR